MCNPVRHGLSKLIHVSFAGVKISSVLKVEHDDGITAAHKMVVPWVVVGGLDAELKHRSHCGEKGGPGAVAEAFAVEDGNGVALKR
ncbi:hypothetical protein NEMBOFW57_008793 [Staphylotrichum longicolle]|uniref:Uncharacterized protein n=1 Tax=Staphylotrichum longicolle TaxID=669026 RepID=A0AAD4ERX0_9PEZI|nr:hypothetical protein NEMBOFW57_008793 [Staphylotrichum longicolle]